MAFSPDGGRLTVLWHETGAETGSLKMWNAATGAKLLDIPLSKGMSGTSLTFSPDGSRLAGSTAARENAKQGESWTHSVTVWDAGKGTELRSWQWRADNPYTEIDFRPDGARLAALCMDGTLRIWEVAGGREILSRKYTSCWPPHLKYSPDGRLLVCNFGDFGAAKSPRLRDAETGDDLFALAGHSGSIAFMVFSPDGRRIATSGTGRRGKSELKLWDAGSGQELLSFASEERNHRLLHFSADGRKLMAVDDSSRADWVQVWDATPLLER